MPLFEKGLSGRSLPPSRRSRLIDWDEHLSAHSLSSRFNVAFKAPGDDGEFEFAPFTFDPLPREFIRFAQAPFNFPVDQTREFSLFSLLDYNWQIQSYDEHEHKHEDKNSIVVDYKSRITRSTKGGRQNAFLYMNYSRKNYPSVLLCIGMYASTLIVIDESRITFLRPFYLDRYGCTDEGYRRNQPLFLNEDRYERFIDQILSGDFSNDLQPF